MGDECLYNRVFKLSTPFLLSSPLCLLLDFLGEWWQAWRADFQIPFTTGYEYNLYFKKVCC